MENKLVTINPQEFGLEKTEAQKIEAVFTPMIDKMIKLEKSYNVIIKLPKDIESMQRARELRLKYVKIRTGTDEIHKKAKAYYLAGGRFVDAWRNAQKFSVIGKEAELEKIEKHFEILKEAEKEKENVARIAKLKPYVENIEVYNLKDMSVEGFDALLKSSKIAFEAQAEAEKKAEKERIEKEKEEKAEQDRIRKENIKLKKDAEKIEAERQKERKIEADKLAVAEAEREKERIEKEAIEAKIEKEKEDKLAQERETEALLKKKEFNSFLSENGWTEETKIDFIVKDDGENYLLFKKIAEFKK